MVAETIEAAPAICTAKFANRRIVVLQDMSADTALANSQFINSVIEVEKFADLPVAGSGEASQTPTVIEDPERTNGLNEDDLKNLSSLFGREISENTRLNYRAQWKRFLRWAGGRKVSALPAKPIHVAAYLAERVERNGSKPATLHAAAAAIAFVHRATGLEDPCSSPEVRKAIGGATRGVGNSQKQAEALTASALESIRATACKPRRGRGGKLERPDTAMRRGEMDIAIISLMRDALLRVSESAALNWEDLEEVEDGTGRLLIRRSKTDRDGDGAIAFVSAPTMRALRSIRSGASGKDSIFGLRPRQISMRIKQAARRAGLGEGYSGHSPRVGMARDLARAGTELTRLMTAGRWRSPRMPAHYTRNESVARGAVAQYYGSLDAPFR